MARQLKQHFDRALPDGSRHLRVLKHLKSKPVFIRPARRLGIQL
jgi:hypothetical protein